eukprot:CAMPEP_0184737870 /NCGR_PEP_ID=MMETSP0315-20130426/632_1 /TAXON_ID=101924 /ORGANISM="Rhodosorus marinus, Strain UTEX LB 2760" /LENGTH=83 /DNA_ID=CAMNT_0027205307 /DNA_START=44 /DNA_END=295 /DNA_ORIENTATION=+
MSESEEKNKFVELIRTGIVVAAAVGVAIRAVQEIQRRQQKSEPIAAAEPAHQAAEEIVDKFEEASEAAADKVKSAVQAAKPSS